MPNQQVNTAPASLIAEKLSKDAQTGSLSSVRYRLRAGLRVIRSRFDGFLATNDAPAWARTLLESFFKLESRADAAILALDVPSGLGRSLFTCYDMLEAVFCTEDVAVNEENVVEALSQMDKRETLTDAFFSLLAPMLDAVLVLACANACYGGKSLERCEQLLSHAAAGLAAIESFDWERILRRCSRLERTLLDDASYEGSDANSRAALRAMAARIAKKTGETEISVASAAIERARACGTPPENSVFYQLGLMSGEPERRRHIGVAALCSFWVVPALCSLATALISKSVLWGLVVFLPFAALLRPVMHTFFARRIPAYNAPRLRETSELPAAAAAFCTLLPQPDKCASIYDALRKVYLSNRADNIFFGVIADLPPSRHAAMPDDGERVEAARAQIARLNNEFGERFFLMTRARSHSGGESFCGHERKRGALLECMRLLSGRDSTLSCCGLSLERLCAARFLLTLDEDSMPDPGSVSALLAVAAHPANRAVVDKKGRVISGWGIFVPRLYTAWPREGQTRFQAMLSPRPGTGYGAQGALLQDAFGRTAFAGKGMFDIELCERLMSGFLPDGCVLSHDVLEGAYLRACLVDGAKISEQEPRDVMAWLRRLHRWQRGDWQNLRFAGAWFHVGAVRRENTISAFGRFLIIDNIMTALSAPALALCALLS